MPDTEAPQFRSLICVIFLIHLSLHRLKEDEKIRQAELKSQLSRKEEKSKMIIEDKKDFAKAVRIAFFSQYKKADFHSVEFSKRTGFYTIKSLSRVKFYSNSKRYFLT